MADSDRPKLPVLGLHEIIRWREKIHDLLLPYLGQQPNAQELQALTHALTKELATGRVKGAQSENVFDAGAADQIRPAVYETLCAYAAGVIIDDNIQSEIAARIAGNLRRLRAGHPVLPFAGLSMQEWALAMILDAEIYHTPKRHIPGALLRFSILTGTAAGKQFVQFFPEGILNRMARKLKLLKHRERRLIYPWELVKFKLAVQLDVGTELNVHQFVERESLNKWNKELVEARDPKIRQCPKYHKFPCYLCPFGFETCPMGTHREDYVTRRCGTHEGAFPPNSTRRYCLRCEAARWRAAR